jgi:hypothetical protein
MIIEIKPHADGTWAVVAHTPRGLVHDFLPTPQAALDFARDFYGMLLETEQASKIPQTAQADLLKHNTAFEVCFCHDFEYRGGSYRDPINGDKICKHMYLYRTHVRKAQAFNAALERHVRAIG